MGLPAGASGGGPAIPAFNVSDDSVLEHDGAEVWFDISVTVPGGTSSVQYHLNTGSATNNVDYGTPSDNDANPNDGLATFSSTGASDCTAPAGPRTTCVRVTVPVVNDSLVEPDEDFFLNLTDPTGASIGDGQGRAVIVNDDEAAPPPACNIQCELAKQSLTLIEFLHPALPAIFKQELVKLASGQGSFIGLTTLVQIFGSLKIQMTLKLLGTALKKKAGASAGAPTFTVSTTTAFDQTGQKVIVLSVPKRARKLMGKAKKVKATLAASFTDTSGATANDSLSVTVKPKKKKKKK
jgi:hypothetical protein